MRTPWLQSGRPIISLEGLPILCSQCPCDTEVVGCEQVQEAILERQKAYGITLAWSSFSPTNTGGLIATWAQKNDYTIGEYQDYINAIAPKFLDGTYSAGPSAPTLLTGTYADSTIDCSELYSLICDMLTTKETPHLWDENDNALVYDHLGLNNYLHSSWADAKTEVEANWPDDIYGHSMIPGWAGMKTTGYYSSNFGTYYQAAADITCNRLTLKDLSTELEKSVRFFRYIEISDPNYYDVKVFDANGFSKVTGAENEYVLDEEVDGGTNSVVKTTDYFPDYTVFTSVPNWCAEPLVVIGEYHTYRGWESVTKVSLIDWSFTHT